MSHSRHSDIIARGPRRVPDSRAVRARSAGGIPRPRITSRTGRNAPPRAGDRTVGALAHADPDESSYAQRYLSRVSGPVLDRIDIQVAIPPVPYEALAAKEGAGGESSRDVLKRVEAARERQRDRAGEAHAPARADAHADSTTGSLTIAPLNARLTPDAVGVVCRLDRPGETLLRHAMEHLGLSARAYHRILRVARTIADLAGEEAIRPPHVAEAIQYRSLDRLRGNPTRKTG